MKKIWEKTVTKFVLICLLATGANLFGFVFMKWGALAAFIASGLLIFWVWKEDHPWSLKFFAAVIVFFLSAGLFYAVLPFMNRNWIRNGPLVVSSILFIVFYWLGCYVGSFLIRKPASQ